MIWSRPETRVLFVCTANICRSPLAEGLLRHRLRAMNLAGRVQVHSAGTRVAAHGSRPDPRVEQIAAQHGVTLAGIRARMLTPSMIHHSDYVLVMENRHLVATEELRRAPDNSGGISWRELFAEQKRNTRICLLGSFIADPERDTDEIPDPYFGDLQGFHTVYDMIDSALDGFLLHMDMYFEETVGKK